MELRHPTHFKIDCIEPMGSGSFYGRQLRQWVPHAAATVGSKSKKEEGKEKEGFLPVPSER